ncbi:hypothetical protein LguiB_033665 [Lonicera macranthoides]
MFLVCLNELHIKLSWKSPRFQTQKYEASTSHAHLQNQIAFPFTQGMHFLYPLPIYICVCVCVCIILIGYDLEFIQQGNVKEGEPNPVFQRQKEQVKFIKSLAPSLMAAIVALSPILNPEGQISYIYTQV